MRTPPRFHVFIFVLALTSATLAPTNRLFRLAWQATPGREYRVEASSNLLAWSAVTTNLMALSTNLTWSTNATEPRQFFRVHRVP